MGKDLYHFDEGVVIDSLKSLETIAKVTNVSYIKPFIPRLISLINCEDEKFTIPSAKLLRKISNLDRSIYYTADIHKKIDEILTEAQGYCPTPVIVSEKISIEEPPSYHTLIIEVRDIAAKKPIEGATVFLDGSLKDNPIHLQRNTDIDGKVLFGKLIKGKYNIKVTAVGFAEYKRELNLNSKEKIFVDLEKLAKLKICIYEENTNMPLENIKITLNGSSSVTDQKGEAIFMNLSYKKYDIQISADDYESFSKSIQITKLDHTETIILKPISRISEKNKKELESLKKMFEDAYIGLPYNCDLTIPNYYRNICLELFKLIDIYSSSRLLANKYNKGEILDKLIHSMEKICLRTILIITNYKNINDYIVLGAKFRSEEVHSLLNLGENSQIINCFANDRSKFIDNNKQKIIRKLESIDKKIMENLSNFSVNPIVNIWNICNGILNDTYEDELEEATFLLLANFILDFIDEMFRNPEIVKRLKALSY